MEAPSLNDGRNPELAIDPAWSLRPISAPLVGMSTSQHEVWLDQNAWPTSAHLNIGGGAFILGELNLAHFRAALRQLVAQNEALRLVPAMNGDQLLLDSYEPTLEIVEIASSPDPKRAVRDWWNAWMRQPFLLGEKPPWRMALLRVDNALHGLTIQFHHLVMDGWGTTLVMKRWGEIYNAIQGNQFQNQSSSENQPDPASLSYLRFIQESKSYLDSPAHERDSLFWLNRLPHLPPPLIDRKFPEARQNGLVACDLVVKSIARTQYDALTKFAQANGATTFNLVLAAMAVYFSRTCQQTNVLVGVPSLNRNGRSYRNTMGMFVGVMAIDVDVAKGITTKGLLAGIAANMRQALRHSRFPLSELGRHLGTIQAGREGVFDLLLSFERQDYDVQFGAARLVGSRQLFSGIARFPLGVTVCEFHDDEDLELILEGSRMCFATGETSLMAERIWHLTCAMAGNPDVEIEQLSLLPSAERVHLLDELHEGLETGTSPAPYIAQFEHQVSLRPHAVALVWGQESLTYEELNSRANRLALRLCQFGSVKNAVIALAIERSMDMVVSLLAISKAGAAFLPLDPDTPVARMSDILVESNASVFLIKEHDQERLAHLHRRTLIADWILSDESLTASAQGDPPAATDLAYVLFTSGSTGRPKGVMIEHGTLSRRLAWLSQAYGVTAQDRTAQATQVTFDPSLIELCLPLIQGASIALPPAGRVLPESLAEFAVAYGVTIMAFVPSTLSRFLDAAAGLDGLKLRVACCGGEVLPAELANRYLAITKGRLFNVYGPTETAIFATAWECEARPLESTLPIGRPIADSRIYILDGGLNLMPFGVTGEIYIAGQAVARGYLNRPDLTAGVFLEDPFQPGARMYKSGDRGWLSTDGNLNFVGRSDRQIKLRGYRIELGEIEAALASVEGVRQAAAKLIERDGKAQIHAWVAANGAQTSAHLQRTLRLRLPSYMIPGGIDVLPHLPQSSVGKIDYFSLPLPQVQPVVITNREPENQLESELLALWQQVLKRPGLQVTDNFFDVGGDSLAAVSILTGVEKIIGRRVPMYLITERPTVEGLAAALGEGTASTGLMIHLGREGGNHTSLKGSPAVVYMAASGHGDLMRFQALARALEGACDLRMLQPPSASTIAKTVDLAALYANVVTAKGGGPCYLAGFSVGGLAALETSRLLTASGVEVKALFLVDTIYPSRLWGGTFFWRLLRRLVDLFHIQDLSMNGRRLGVMLNDPGLFSQVMAVSGYRPSRFEGPTHLIKSAGLATKLDGLLFWGWRRLLGNRLREYRVPGLHGSMFDTNNVDQLGNVIKIAVGTVTVSSAD
jgi:amino acid adenylation domain-containing protein